MIGMIRKSDDGLTTVTVTSEGDMQVIAFALSYLAANIGELEDDGVFATDGSGNEFMAGCFGDEIERVALSLSDTFRTAFYAAMEEC